MNFDSSWYALHNVLEYYRWFSSGMLFGSDMNFLPLGGNTVFVRKRFLELSNGWPETLTEDCSLGVLLAARHDVKTSVFYDPKYTTREETPHSIEALFKQRVRWNQGFFHEWRKGVWRHLPSRKQRVLAGYVLLAPVIMSFAFVLLIVSGLTAFQLKLPLVIALLSYVPFTPVCFMVVIQGLHLQDFGKAYGIKIKIRHYLTLVVTYLPYQVLLNAAAFWSVVREIRGDQTWYKTEHKGLGTLTSNDLLAQHVYDTKETHS